MAIHDFQVKPRALEVPLDETQSDEGKNKDQASAIDLFDENNDNSKNQSWKYLTTSSLIPLTSHTDFSKFSSISWFSYAPEPLIHTASEGLAVFLYLFFSSLDHHFQLSQISDKYPLLLESVFGFIIAHSTPLLKDMSLFATPTRL